MRRALVRRPSVEAERAAHAYVAILIAEAHVQQIDGPAFGWLVLPKFSPPASFPSSRIGCRVS